MQRSEYQQRRETNGTVEAEQGAKIGDVVREATATLSSS
jgi:hypothetical protein